MRNPIEVSDIFVAARCVVDQTIGARCYVDYAQRDARVRLTRQRVALVVNFVVDGKKVDDRKVGNAPLVHR